MLFRSGRPAIGPLLWRAEMGGAGSQGGLNFGGISEVANLTFGTLNLVGYNVSVSGFALNNQLKYAAASEASGLSLLSSFSFDDSYMTSFSPGTSTFTITAIPEPSTYVVAAGLLGLMLWSARRRAR